MSTKTTPAPVQRTRRRAQITRRDVVEIARLVAKRLSVAEACECLGLRARTFYQWRERHKNQAEFETLLTRVRGQYIAANLREMEKAAAGKDGVRHDWRSAHALAGIAAGDNRYSPQQPPADPVRQPAMNPAVVNIWVELGALMEPPRPAGAIVDTTAEEVKQLADKPADPTPAPAAPPPRRARSKLP